MIEFVRTPHPDNTIEFTWITEDFGKFSQVVDMLKAAVPSCARRFCSDSKTWFIGDAYSSRLDDIETVVKAGGLESNEIRALRAEAQVRHVFNAIAQLRDPQYSRAVYAAKVAMGILEAPFSYSLTLREFGAWSKEDECWYYTNGNYSGKSPEEMDAKAKESALLALGTRIREMDRVDQLDALIDAKAMLRAQILEKRGRRCYVCSVSPEQDRQLHMHRVTPGKDGGLYVESNIALLCFHCHRKYEGEPWDALHKARAQSRQ